MDSLGKWLERFGVWGMEAGKMMMVGLMWSEVQIYSLSAYVNIKEGDLGWRDSLGKFRRAATVENLKEKKKEVMAIDL